MALSASLSHVAQVELVSPNRVWDPSPNIDHDGKGSNGYRQQQQIQNEYWVSLVGSVMPERIGNYPGGDRLTYDRCQSERCGQQEGQHGTAVCERSQNDDRAKEDA